MANYCLSNKAISDLSDIWNYTFDIWSESQADKYYHLLLGCCKELAEAKVSGRNYPEVNEEIFGFRIAQHIIFYQKHQKDKIAIVRILNSMMDLKLRLLE